MPRLFTSLINPVGPDCNIVCEYCFYAYKSELFTGRSYRMTLEVLECLVKSYLGLRFLVSSFAWQGGDELILMGLEFYRQVMDLQKRIIMNFFHILNGSVLGEKVIQDKLNFFLDFLVQKDGSFLSP